MRKKPWMSSYPFCLLMVTIIDANDTAFVNIDPLPVTNQYPIAWRVTLDSSDLGNSRLSVQLTTANLFSITQNIYS